MTTLQLVYAAQVNYLHTAIRMPFNQWITDFEAADLTVDCNLAGQPPTYPDERARVACGAVNVNGSHLRVRRVRATHFGTQGKGTVLENPECFVIRCAGAYHDSNPDPHDCVIEDCIIAQPSENNTRETTCIIMTAGEPAYSGHMSYHRGCVIRNCHVDCQYANGVSSHWILISSQTRDPGNPLRAILQTATPHRRTADDIVVVFLPEALDSYYNGAFEIETVDPANNKLTYLMNGDPGGDATGNKFIGVSFQAFAADGGIAAVIEGNYARQVRVGVFHDTFSTKDLTIRNNHFTDVVAGVQENMGERNPPKVGSALTHVGKTATFTTVLDHGLAPGDAVIIENTTYPEYNNGTLPPPPRPPAWEVKTVPGLNAFTYEMLSVPDGDEPSPPAFTFRTLWQERRLAIEANVLEVAAAISPWGQPTGVYLEGGAFVSPYVYRQVIVRDNIIRHPVGVSDPPGIRNSWGIFLASCEAAVIQNNVIDVEYTYPIIWRYIGSMRLFNNRTSDGKILDGCNDGASQWWRDAARDVDDAFVLAMI